MLTIGQYTLLVADACAGMNSIFALEAIGVFYLSVMKYTNNLRSILLAILILPISFVSNVIRVVVLVLVTYYFGDEAGQGFVHGFAGILLFMVATALTIGLDGVIGWFVPGHVRAPKAAQ
jgi:exosortase/archaeosortase family protein